MHNYLKVVADIFYESYDERKFPTVLARIMVRRLRCRLKSTGWKGVSPEKKSMRG